MSNVILRYVQDDGVHVAVMDNPYGGETTIGAETVEALDLAIERERSFIASLTLGIAEPIADIESAFEADNIYDCGD